MTEGSTILKRAVRGIQIPSGDVLEIPAGSEVRITQNLGGTCTVVTDQGLLARVNELDFDALGLEAPKEKSAADFGPITKETLEKLVWDELKTCFDPEIPVNIVELGLVYKCDVQPLNEKDYQVMIEMTLTAPGCGMGPVLQTDVESKVSKLPGVKSAKIFLVFEPQWEQTMMSEAARLQLGFF